MKKVLTFGTFDILHKGHEHYLEEAKKHGDHLTVVIARDATVENVKGFQPTNSEQERLNAIAALSCVDMALLGNPGDKLKVVEEVEPHVVCLGYDQTAFTEKLEESLAARGLQPAIKRITSHKPDQFKSSILRKP